MKSEPTLEIEELVETWALPSAATLGSSVRKRGIFLEVRARLAVSARKALKIEAGGLALRMPISSETEFRVAHRIVEQTLDGVESLAVIPREIQDILNITTTERHRWLKDGRLPSAGTRTVTLRGRAKKITFHVFDPRMVEDVLDGDLVVVWRENDAVTAAENRRRAALNRKLSRSAKAAPDVEIGESGGSRPHLIGWAEFERDGPL